jgi:hypothetical protein
MAHYNANPVSTNAIFKAFAPEFVIPVAMI